MSPWENDRCFTAGALLSWTGKTDTEVLAARDALALIFN